MFKMSVLNFLKNSISIISKDVIPSVYVRTFCSEPTEKWRVVAKINVQRHPVEKCIQYMDSEAYKITYGDNPVWHTYVRNFRGGLPPPTRKNCVVFGRIRNASPCPICRDCFLLADYRNIKLLKQFISPHGGEILETSKTGVCQAQQLKLKIAIKKAQNYGYLTYPVPHRHYNYKFYSKQ